MKIKIKINWWLLVAATIFLTFVKLLNPTQDISWWFVTTPLWILPILFLALCIGVAVFTVSGLIIAIVVTTLVSIFKPYNIKNIL